MKIKVFCENGIDFKMLALGQNCTTPEGEGIITAIHNPNNRLATNVEVKLSSGFKNFLVDDIES